MVERGALTRAAGEAAADGDTGELHDDRGHEAMGEGSLHQLIHGNIGLDDGRLGGLVDLEDVAQGTDVDDLGTMGRPGAVGRAVEDAERLAAVVEGLDCGRDLVDGRLVGVEGHSAKHVFRVVTGNLLGGVS